MLSIISLVFYMTAWGLLAAKLKRRATTATYTRNVLAMVALGLLAHAPTAYQAVIGDAGYHLGMMTIASLFFWVIIGIVFISCLKKPLENLFIFLLPMAALAIVSAKFGYSETTSKAAFEPPIVAHILLSIIAYSLLTIASVQALLLAYQNHQLRHKQLRGIVSMLPPLQTMETLLFELIWAGEILLTASILTGVFFIEDIFAQHLSHKTVFSLLSWGIYAVLLFGRHTMGWRGAAAIRWTLIGFSTLMLAYFGSKIVLEIIL